MKNLSDILTKLPDTIRHPIESLPQDIIKNMEEIRIKVGYPIYIITGTSEIIVEMEKKRIVSREMIEIILNNLLNYSIYAYEEELANGYITIEGGHRVGVCGRIIKENGKSILIKDISSLNIRCSREFPGIAEDVVRKIYDSQLGLQNTIIVSPPKCGKTTLLRDMIRILSNNGFRIGVCDERSEIAGMYQGKASYDLGPRTDILDGCLKAEGMILLIRSMSPDVIVTDEIGKAEDIEAIESAVCAGVHLITTVHGRTYDDLISSRLKDLIERKVFTRIIFLSNIPVTGTISEVKYV